MGPVRLLFYVNNISELMFMPEFLEKTRLPKAKQNRRRPLINQSTFGKFIDSKVFMKKVKAVWDENRHKPGSRIFYCRK